MPGLEDTEAIVAHSKGKSWRCPINLLTAPSRTSGE
jgi:hypothetical protein